MHILITGGCGFIGSHVVRHFLMTYPQYHIVNLDKLTYAGNPNNLKDVEHFPNYSFVRGDICDAGLAAQLFDTYKFDGVIHLAAESHVDRSILNPMEFVQTNVIGTVTLLQVAKEKWKDMAGKRFYHVSTDEVYGTLELEDAAFTETTPYQPQSPYSASKASSDHFVRAYANTYKLPVVISNCSNNYGPNQFPEKLIPLFIANILENRPLPVYGKGENIRDWLWVKDHAVAIDAVFHRGRLGETYNIGGDNELKNIELVRLLCQIMDSKLNRPEGTSAQLINYITDRPGHDLRYAINFSKLNQELGWQPSLEFQQGLELTVDWYLQNQEWVENVRSGAYRTYYEQQYGGK